MDLHLEGKKAVITASTGGIGYAIARKFLEEGAVVMINGRKELKAHEKSPLYDPVNKLHVKPSCSGLYDSCGKAVSGALPLSAVLSRAEILDVDGSLNSTHGGSPLPCASALANLKYIEEHHLVEEAKRKEKILLEKLNEMKDRFPDRIIAIHGMGLAFAAVVVKPGTRGLDVELVDRVIERAFEKGVMSIRTMTGTIKLGPPLTISDDALREAMDVLIEAMGEIVEESGKG